ncbi:MAG: transposase [Candidatus Bathyarchaeia archaeon]
MMGSSTKKAQKSMYASCHSRNGRKPKPYNIELYKRIRSAVERFYGWIKSLRRIVIRYERLAITYKAFITIACIMIHLRYGV